MQKKNTKIWLLLIVTMICICLIMGLYAYYLYVSTWKATVKPYRHTVLIFFNQTVTDDGWHLEVNNFWADSNDDCKDRTLVCELHGNSVLERVELSKIKNKPSSGYNITWFDNDNNNYLSIGDVIFVSKTGGSIGKACSGNEIWIVDTINENVFAEGGKLQ